MPRSKSLAHAPQLSPETLKQLTARLSREADADYAASPFSVLSEDYFSRFSRDLDAQPRIVEIEIDSKWTIVISEKAQPLTRLMAGHLADFLKQRMRMPIRLRAVPATEVESEKRCFILLDEGGGDPKTPESFTLSVTPERVRVHGRDPAGLRDGIVRIVNLMGLRQGPFLEKREQVYRPRLTVRLGAVPWMGSFRDLVFMGFNAVLLPEAQFHALSLSDAIPELAVRRELDLLKRMHDASEEAAKYGLKTYCWVSSQRKFPKDDPILVKNPEIRGALTWKEDGEYILCTEHPLVRRYYRETVEGIFRSIPGLSGLVMITGGEGFYHCFMHPHGAKIGHTTCPRCEALGADTVVANLCNTMAEAARKMNPEAQVVAWMYSAEHVWATGDLLARTIRKLGAGTSILTEVEKEAVIEKPDGLRKWAWDYSIDAIGPCERAKEQIAECRASGIPIYMKSEPELAFEASRLADVPCLDRWLDRAEALASCGATGVFCMPAFRKCYGSVAAEIFQWMWWDPCRNKEWILENLADRVAGHTSGPSLRNAWRLVSEAIAYSPQIPGYYNGPHYMGPAHPMCADPEADLPPVFYCQYLFRAEITDDEGLKFRPMFWKNVQDGEVLLRFYRKMEGLLGRAVEEIRKTQSRVPERCRLPYAAEVSQIRWFYHTARTEANFYESCLLRDRLLALASQRSKTRKEVDEALKLHKRWHQVLMDEQRNVIEAIPVAKADMRLDWYYGRDHTAPHAADMLHAKLKLLRKEIHDFLPSVRRRIRADNARD